MTKKRNVESYGQAIMDLLKAASERELRLPMPDKKTAIRTRHDVYSCRAAMRREGHYLIVLADQVVIPEPFEEDGVWYLCPQPTAVKETFLRDALIAAGVVGLEEASHGESDATPTSGQAALDDYLSNN